MFEAYSADRLERLLTLHPVTRLGRAYIERALSAPSRNAQGTPHNVVVDTPCPKMRWNSQAESSTVERPAILMHIFDPDVIGYTVQCPPLDIKYVGRNGRKVRTVYTGDCLCLHQSRGCVLEEWKPASDRDDLAELYPGKYQKKEDGTYSSEAIEEALKPYGLKFALRFDDEIDRTGHRNRVFLAGYLQPRAEQLYREKLAEVALAFQGEPFATLAQLVERGADRDATHWAIATSRLTIDYDWAPLAAAPNDLRVFRSAAEMQAWKLALRPDGSRPTTDVAGTQPRFERGDVFYLDGVRFEVSVAGASTIYVAGPNGPQGIELPLLLHASQQGKLVLPERMKAGRSANSKFIRATADDFVRAMRKLQVLETLDNGQLTRPEDSYSPSTLRRWRRLIREGATHGQSPLEALLDDQSSRGYRGPHIDPVFSQLLNDSIASSMSEVPKKSLRLIYEDVREIAEARGYTMVALSSFYERAKLLKSLETIKASEGRKVAYQLAPSHWMLERTTPLHCERAMELVHIDSTLLDIEARSSLSGEVLGRPWLTIAVCAHTRCVVGMYLSVSAPSHVSSMMVLADIVKRFGRVPEGVIHDWGSEFKAKDFKYALTALYINRFVRPKSAPRFGAILERLFGTTTSELIANWLGSTKARKQVRQLGRDVDPSNHSGLWLQDIFQALEEFFFEMHNVWRHTATLLKPAEAMEASFIAHGQRVQYLRTFDQVAEVLMPTAKGAPRSLDPARGVYVNYRYYGHPALTSLGRKGAAMLVKPIPFDMSCVLVHVGGRWERCKAPLFEDFHALPDVLKRCLYEEWQMEQRLLMREGLENYRKLRDLNQRVNEKAMRNRAEQGRDREADLLRSPCFPAPQDAPPAAESGTSPAWFEELMQKAIARAASQPLDDIFSKGS